MKLIDCIIFTFLIISIVRGCSDKINQTEAIGRTARDFKYYFMAGYNYKEVHNVR